jgi:hypothetical protein
MAVQETAAETPPQESGHRPVRARALVLGFLLCFPVCYAAPNQQISHMFSLLVAPVGALLLLILLNVVLRRLGPKVALSGGDLVVIFSITSVACAMSAEWAWVGHSAIHAFPIAERTSPTVRDYLLPNMPDWLVVKDLELVEEVPVGGFGMGHVLGKLPIYFPRYLGWAIPMVGVSLALLFINSLMRGAWCQRERLAFPIIQLPVSASENGGAGPMWRSRHMWIAFGIMFSIQILNGINYLYPNVPSIPVKELIDIRSLFTEPPLSNMGYLPIAIFPFMAAIGIFMPSDLLFSLIVFFFLRKLTHVVLASQGIPQHTFSGTAISPGPPYFDEQTWGAALALFIGALWISRGYLREVWLDIRSGARAPDGGIKHRWAFVGLVACTVGVIAYGMYGELPLSYMLVYIGLIYAFSFVLTRVRAQIGPPTHEFAFFGPNSFMHRFFGNNWLNDRQATWVSQGFITVNRIHRTHPMPYQLEGMKMGYIERLKQRPLFLALAAATVLGFFLGYFFLHVFAYRTGNFYRWVDGEIYLRNILNNRHGPDTVGITMTLFGFAAVMAMDAARFRFPAFPLHPAGYMLSMNFGVDYYWFGLLIALIVKNFVQRYYGLRGYDRLRGVALGVLVGEYAAETIWMTMALVTNQSTYTMGFNDRGLGAQ